MMGMFIRRLISRMSEATGFKVMFYGAIALGIAVLIGIAALIAEAVH